MIDNDQRDSDWVPRAKYETASKAAMKAMESSAAWKKAHEDLLAVRQQDITALTNRAEKAEAERDAGREVCEWIEQYHPREYAAAIDAMKP